MINRSTKSFSHEFFRLGNKIETIILPCAKMKRIPAKTETKNRSNSSFSVGHLRGNRYISEQTLIVSRTFSSSGKNLSNLLSEVAWLLNSGRNVERRLREE